MPVETLPLLHHTWCVLCASELIPNLFAFTGVDDYPLIKIEVVFAVWCVSSQQRRLLRERDYCGRHKEVDNLLGQIEFLKQ
jgi:hypothetical protein